jgi:hypothetical protein
MALSDTGLRRPILLTAQGIALLASLLLIGCGQITQTESGSQSGSQSATQSATQAASQTATTTSTDHNTATNGCPSKQIPVDGGNFRPAVTATYTLDQGAVQPISVARGQGLEIHLAPTAQWSLTLSDADHTLESLAPEGWYDAPLDACVWRFAASNAGVARLDFRGLVLCQPNLHCKAALEAAAFAVTTH